VLSQENRTMPKLDYSFRFKVRQRHSLQVKVYSQAHIGALCSSSIRCLVQPRYTGFHVTILINEISRCSLWSRSVLLMSGTHSLNVKNVLEK